MKTKASPAAKIGDHLDDIQALVGSGFSSLRHCDYLLLQIGDAALAKDWIDRLLASGCIHCVADLGRARDESGSRRRLERTVALAFTHAGLGKLGLHAAADAPFPSAFTQGMGSAVRARLLGDVPAVWAWGDCGDGSVDLLLAHYRAEPSPPGFGPLDPAAIGRAGLRIVASIATCPSYIGERDGPDGDGAAAYEPFGFRDGIAQPVIRGLRLSSSDQQARLLAGERHEDRLVAAGEFVLGHDNEYGEPAHCPDVQAWREPQRAATPRPSFGFNGSYLAVRQIWQDVEGFRRYEAGHPAPPGEPTVAESMVGRRRDGRSLLNCPFETAEIDAIRYRVDDFDGLQCPRGAHVRRANPRDMLGWDLASGIAASKLHRLLRRGRVYRAEQRACGGAEPPSCGDAAHRARCGQGLFFVALNADLDRQFEFVQQRWIVGRSFGDLRDEDDPLLGSGPGRAFSVQALPVGRRFADFDRFTKVIGGGYFFLPSLSALRFIARA